MATTFATNDDVRALHPGLDSKPVTQLNPARSAAYSRIISALVEGGYAIATFTDSPSSFSTLTLLECRLVALDLLGGGSTSARTKAGGNSFSLWKETVDQMLKLISSGRFSILNDVSGDVVSGPSFDSPGIISDERNPGINLTDPSEWTSTDPLEEY